MSKQLLKIRIYTEKDFKKASRIERIGMYLIQPNLMLSPSDEAYKAKLLQIFHIQCEAMSQMEIIRKVTELYPRMKLATVHKMMTDAESVFGSLMKRNKDVTRAVLIEKARRIHDIALEGIFIDVFYLDEESGQEKSRKEMIQPPNLKQANEALKLIAKLEQLDQPDSVENVYDNLTFPEMTFTTDPAALTEDAEFEEVEDESE